MISYEFRVSVEIENMIHGCCHYYGMHTSLTVQISMGKVSMTC